MLRELLHLFFPVTCICCENILHNDEEYLCLSCLACLPILEDKHEPIVQKLAGRIRSQHSFSFLKFNKKGVAQKLLHELKYNRNPQLGIYLGTLLADSLLKSGSAWDIDCLVPVPMHAKRQTQRGYNQAEQIAKGISKRLDIPVNTSILFKVKENESQTKKSRMARIVNLKDCFEAKRGEMKEEMKIALVDDVITTGATFEACAMALEQSGTPLLSVMAFAVA